MSVYEEWRGLFYSLLLPSAFSLWVLRVQEQQSSGRSERMVGCGCRPQSAITALPFVWVHPTRMLNHAASAA